MKGTGPLLTSGFFVCVFAAMLVLVRGYPERAALVPEVIAVPGLLLSIVQFAVDLRRTLALRAAAGGEVVDGGSSPERRAEFAMVGWIFAILVLILLLGFWVGIALYLPLYLRCHGREPWKVTVALTAGGWVCLYVVFQVLLKVPLFEGFLFGLLS